MLAQNAGLLPCQFVSDRLASPDAIDATVPFPYRGAAFDGGSGDTAQEPAPLSDEQIRQLIEQKLQAKKLLKDSFDVSVETGVVHSEVERVKAERIANSTFGVLSVENLLRLDR